MSSKKGLHSKIKRIAVLRVFSCRMVFNQVDEFHENAD